jgi:hypothetical protein
VGVLRQIFPPVSLVWVQLHFTIQDWVWDIVQTSLAYKTIQDLDLLAASSMTFQADIRTGTSTSLAAGMMLAVL